MRRSFPKQEELTSFLANFPDTEALVTSSVALVTTSFLLLLVRHLLLVACPVSEFLFSAFLSYCLQLFSLSARNWGPGFWKMWSALPSGLELAVRNQRRSKSPKVSEQPFPKGLVHYISNQIPFFSLCFVKLKFAILFDGPIYQENQRSILLLLCWLACPYIDIHIYIYTHECT